MRSNILQMRSQIWKMRSYILKMLAQFQNAFAHFEDIDMKLHRFVRNISFQDVILNYQPLNIGFTNIWTFCVNKALKEPHSFAWMYPSAKRRVYLAI